MLFNNQDIEQGVGGSISTEEAINVLVKSYQSSEIFKQVQQQVAYICERVTIESFLFNGLKLIDYILKNVSLLGLKRGEMLEKKGSQASFITQCIVLTKRSFVNMYRDLGYYWLRLAIYIALCLCVGTIFHDIGLTYGSIQVHINSLVLLHQIQERFLHTC